MSRLERAAVQRTYENACNACPVQDSEAADGKRLGALWGYVGVNAGELMAAYLCVSSVTDP
jgi:hypothetical protein